MTATAVPSDFEKFVAECFRELGLSVRLPANPNQRAYDFELTDDKGRRVAVQVKSRKSGSLPHPFFNNLSIFLSSFEGSDFDYGIVVVNTSFSQATINLLNAVPPEPQEKYVYAAVVQFPKRDVVFRVHHPFQQVSCMIPPDPGDPEPDPRMQFARVAVFTEKGGVGKTSCAAHIAGALMYLGDNTVLVDCDGQKNLKLLLGAGVNIKRKDGTGVALVVEDYGVFNVANYPDCFVVYDCPPSFENTPQEIFKECTDVVIPVVLSPLSVLGNAEVIERTIKQILNVNPKVRCHIIVNQYVTTRTAASYNQQMFRYIEFHTAVMTAKNPNVKLYKPDEVSIRRSDILLHWGMFLLRQGAEPHLAFSSNVTGAQNLLSDFLSIATVLTDASVDQGNG